MNSLTVNNRLPQLRGIPVPGFPLFRYERMVSGRWVPCNHSRAKGIVGVLPEGETLMRKLNRWFKDHRGVPVRVIRWEPETQRVIYLRQGYKHECFSPLEQFQRKFREIGGEREH